MSPPRASRVAMKVASTRTATSVDSRACSRAATVGDALAAFLIKASDRGLRPVTLPAAPAAATAGTAADTATTPASTAATPVHRRLEPFAAIFHLASPPGRALIGAAWPEAESEVETGHQRSGTGVESEPGACPFEEGSDVC